MKRSLQRLGRILTGLLLATGLLVAGTPAATAADNDIALTNYGQDDISSAKPIAVNQWASGSLTDSGDNDWFKVQTPSTGVISLSFSNEQRQNGDWNIKLYDPDLNEYYTYSFQARSTNHDPTSRIAVPAGTYFIQVYFSDYQHTYTDARYSLKLNFTKTTTWETEHNDQAEKATPLAVNTTINGTLYRDWDNDWYRFDVPTSDSAQILFSNEQRNGGDWDVKLYDANINELQHYSFAANQNSHNGQPINVSAGTYFIQVYFSSYQHTYTDARYSLTVKYGTKGTVTFVSNGGSSVPSQTVKYGSKAKQPANPKRAGYNFTGWYTRDGKKYDFSQTVNGNVTLYAHWAGRQYIIYFDANHGKASAKNKKVTMGAKYGNLPTANRAGYRFLGWYTKQGNKVTSQTTVGMASNRTFVAHWAPRQYTIYFDGNYGKPSAKSKQVTYRAKYGTLPTATRPGYRFVGWYTKQGNRVTSQTIVGMASNRTFVAHWVKIQKAYVREDNKPGARAYSIE